MKNSEHRIFISDLPETATDKEIKSMFNNYGKVTAVEIKTRKELTPKNKSYFFAYVNLDTDHQNLNKCFQDFQNEPWHGDYVKLQIAKESFLDRLKREREEALKKGAKEEGQRVEELPKVNPVVNIPPPKTPKFDAETPDEESHKTLKKKRTISDETSYINEEDTHELDSKRSKKKNISFSLDGTTNDEPVPKLHKVTPNNKLVTKIPSFGNAPVVVYNPKQEKSKNLSAANLKRLESLKNLKKGYQNEKDLIKSALQNIDAQPRSKKIVFDDEGVVKNLGIAVVNGFHKKKNDLFNEDDSDFDEFEGNFEIEEHLEGEKGKKLLELQSKFRNDKRFALDKRFLDNDNETIEENLENNEDESLETEKKKEMNILEKVLGKKISKLTPKKSEKSGPTKSMLRFDPTQDSSNFELEHVVDEPKKKKTKKELREEVEREQNNEKPEVSKEVFYKISDNLKETFQESQGFSLLGAFRRSVDNEDNIDQAEGDKNVDDSSIPKQKSSRNPFKYDSSDDEDETADIPHTNDTSKLSNSQQQTKSTSSRLVFWTESFFFKPDDHRLQDGFDFIEKMKASDDKEFSKVRQGLKGVVRTKVRNSERKNRMFKKKLGGGKSRRRKHIRIKKALKR